MALLAVDVTTLAMTIGGFHGPVRFVIGLVFGVAVPGWSIIGLLNLGNGALEVGLMVSTSLALLMLVAQVLMTLHAWHLVAAQEVICLACLPSLLWQSMGLRRLGEYAS